MMTCEECGKKTSHQKYTDVCNECVNKIMKALWDTQLKPMFSDTVKRLRAIK